MAKASKDEPCMFCGDLPCSCSGTKKKVTSSKKTASPKSGGSQAKRTVATTEEPGRGPVNIKEAMKSRTTTLKAPTEHVQVKMVEAEVPAYDDEFSVALRALKPILHPSEIYRYKDILADPKTRAASWKRRNRNDSKQ